MELITAVDANKYCHKEGKNLHELKNINLRIESGDFTAITGSSGSDRTILLRLLCGIEKPDKGNIFFCGVDTKDMSKGQRKKLYRYSIGTIFQDEKLNPFVSILNNVASPLILKGEKRREALEKSHAILDDFLISELESNKPCKLSKEQRQMVIIARTIIKNTNTLIADEPTVNLNHDNRGKIIHLFNDLNKTEKATIIISTTDDAILEYAKKIILLKDGVTVIKNRGMA